LFFRGQNHNYLAEKKATLYPSIYRGSRVSKEEMEFRFDVLESSCKILVNRLENSTIDRSVIRELKKVKKMQWSILQHYEVCNTPFLDVTQSLNVACSFALNDNNENGYVYILALPYVTGRISVDSEDDITNIRLLNICPHQAKRPFFQEGYLVGTEFILKDYDNKNELDFNNRIVAIYEIENSSSFWGSPKINSSYNRIENKLLYPDIDIFKDICNDIIKQDAVKSILNDEDSSRFLLNYFKISELYKVYDYNSSKHKLNDDSAFEELQKKFISMKKLIKSIIDEKSRENIDKDRIKQEIENQNEIIESLE
jgi:hypothetical protein